MDSGEIFYGMGLDGVGKNFLQIFSQRGKIKKKTLKYL